MPEVSSIQFDPKKRSFAGCAARSTAIAILSLAGGVYLMGRWESASGALRAAAVLLVLVGGLCCIPLMLWVMAKIIGLALRRKLSAVVLDGSDVESLIVGPSMVGKTQTISAEPHQYCPATDADFAALDRDWYDRATLELSALGFIALGEAVNVTASETAGCAVVMRRFVSADSTTMSAVYHIVLPRLSIDDRVCELESELSDGTFVTTSNAERARSVAVPPQIRDAKHAIDTPVAELVRLHQSAQAAVLADRPGTTFVSLRTIEDVNASQHRQLSIKAAFHNGRR